MRFPPEFIERLRHHLPLSEVVGRRVTIRRHGREFQGLCPFHKEKSPSFTVSDEKGFFHCFGCGAHGDAIGFLKDFERVSYPEAVEKLAAEAGLPVPQMTREAEESERRRHTLEDVVTLAARWFAEQFYGSGGAEARAYLRGRGLKRDTVDRFGIGYAPASRDALKTALLKEGASEALLLEAGLLAKPDEGATYDRFRGRVVFPIRDARGRAIAFGGRILPSAQGANIAKYLNSPETPLFKKGETLFAYDVARKAAQDGQPLLVSEGYLDAIALHQAGFGGAVAPLGTAITEGQLRLLWQAAPEPVVCLDSDAAGMRAAMRLADLALPLIKPDFGLRFAALPKGEDPDSLIRGAGAKAMEGVIAQARTLPQVVWDAAFQHFGTASVERKASLERYLMQSADRVTDPTLRKYYREHFKQELFRANQWKRAKGSANGPKSGAPEVALPPLPEANDDGRHLSRLEERVLAVILLHPALLHQAEIEEHFGHLDFTQPVLDKLREAALEVSAAHPSLDGPALHGALAERGFGERVETLLKPSVLPHASRLGIVESLAFAQHAFEKIYNEYTMKKLEHELHGAERVFAAEMTPENQERFLALQKQVDELRRSRYEPTPDEQAS